MGEFTLDDAMETTRNCLKKYQGNRHHEDILQWGYLAAWRTLERYPGVARYHAAKLVVMAVRNAAADWFRSRENPDRAYVRTGGKPLVALSIDRAQEEWDEEPAVPDFTESVLSQVEAERLLKTVPANDRERTILRRLSEGETAPEIAQALGVTPGAIWGTFKRIQTRLAAPPQRDEQDYRGVRTSGEKWVASLSVQNRPVYLGSHASREEAALVYDAAALYYRGKGPYNLIPYD